jgi:hypothetical protein
MTSTSALRKSNVKDRDELTGSVFHNESLDEWSVVARLNVRTSSKLWAEVVDG